MNKEPKFKVGDKFVLLSGNSTKTLTWFSALNKYVGKTFEVINGPTDYGNYETSVPEHYVLHPDWMQPIPKDLPDPITITIQPPPGGEFMVGDEVDHLGNKGKVAEVHSDGPYPVIISRDKGGILSFTKNGIHCVEYGIVPTLSFISRPKKKVKKTFKFWVNFYSDGTCALQQEGIPSSYNAAMIEKKAYKHEIEVESND